MFARELHLGSHVKRFFVQDRGEAGWEVREEHDSEILKQVCYTDWHRVERAMQMFRIHIGHLEAHGWTS